MWKTIQCAVQGRGHTEENIPCQDKTYCYKEGKLIVTALADGAGSAKFSHFGAENITKYICTDMATNFDLYFDTEDGVIVKSEINNKIKLQLSELSYKMKCESRELASTLLVSAIKEDKFILLHIGDGVIGYSKNGELKIASQPENGEFVNTTIFTTSQSVLRTMKIIKGNIGEIDGFILMSDGTEVSLYNKREKKLAGVLSGIMQMMTYISTEAVEAQLTKSFYYVIREATIDDCSISMMVKVSDTFHGYLALDVKSRKKLLQIKEGKRNNRHFKRCDEILTLLTKPRTLEYISKAIHLKPKYTKKRLSKLLSLNFVEKQGVYYHTILFM